ncbi:MAG: hypothetical protein V8T36_10600 [Ruthenibacterium lactatiformans]
MKWRKSKELHQWTVPYLPIDPKDVGVYERDVIRINSQSGKGGIAYILERNYGFDLPKPMREEVGYMMKGISDKAHKELISQEIFGSLASEYLNYFEAL